jgi:hypothetical protein
MRKKREGEPVVTVPMCQGVPAYMCCSRVRVKARQCADKIARREPSTIASGFISNNRYLHKYDQLRLKLPLCCLSRRQKLGNRYAKQARLACIVGSVLGYNANVLPRQWPSSCPRRSATISSSSGACCSTSTKERGHV